MFVNRIQVGQIGTNCYLFGDEAAKVCAIVDPGDEAGRIAQMIKESGMELTYIFITHGHYDHTFGLPGLQELYPDVPVYVHKEEVGPQGLAPNYMKLTPCPNLNYYDEGDRFSLGSLEIVALNTPGHSKGSMILQVGDALFVGDTLFRGSCGRTDFMGGSYEEMVQSLRRLYNLPGDFRVFPGHESDTTLEQERKHNPYMAEAVRLARE